MFMEFSWMEVEAERKVEVVAEQEARELTKSAIAAEGVRIW